MSIHHHHHHSHSHEPRNYNRAFAIGISLNVIFVIVEFVYGTLANSLALIADAGHNLSDVMSLVLAWGASRLAQSQPTLKRTYGLRRATILASLASAFLLLLALGGIAWEALGRLSNPKQITGTVVIMVAAIGVVINAVTAYLFFHDQKHDLNIKAAYLHMAADTVVSLGVVLAGLIILVTGWLWVDPVVSLVVVSVILIGTWGLLQDSINLSMDAVPEGIDLADIKNYLISIDSIIDVHDLHVWALSTTENALTVHLISSDDKINNDRLHRLQHHLQQEFGISHVTVQIENNTEANSCNLNKPECI